MRRALIVVLALVPALLAAPAAPAIEAGDGGTGEGAPPEMERDKAPPETLSVAVNKSRVLQFAEPIKDVLVSQPEILDVAVRTRQQAYMVARKVGTTNVFFLDDDGNVMRRLEVTVNIDAAPLRRLITKVYPDADVRVAAQGKSIFLDGTVSKAEQVDSLTAMARRFTENPDNVVNLLTVDESQQVLLQVRVAEVQRSALKEFGFSPTGSGDRFSFTTSGAAAGSISGDPPFLTGGANPDIFHGATSVHTTFQAMEEEGLVRTLAEPNLIAVSGEEAELLSGGEFPVPVETSTSGGVVQVGYEFKPFGVSLGFTPVVLGAERLSLRLSTEVSERDDQQAITTAQNVTIPGRQVRRANTTVELPSGGTLMIGGLIRNDMTEAVKGIPGLKDLPILGQLFRSQAFRKNESELVIMVTAYVVEPGRKEPMAAPTDNFAPPTDADLFLLGRLQHLYADDRVALDGDEGVSGPVGFMMR